MNGKPFKRILVASDLGAAADRALERAVRLAVAGDGDLAVVCVRDGAEEGPLAHLDVPAIEAELRRHVAAVPGAAALSPLVRCLEAEVVEDAVAEFARAWRADLMVAGGGLAEPVSGLFGVSLAERLSVASPVPLLLVRTKAFDEYANALVPVDFSDLSCPAAVAAMALVPRGGLGLLHVADLPSLAGGVPPLMSPAEEFAALMDGIDFGALTVTMQQRHGVPMVEIAKAVRDERPDLVAMGTAGRTGLGRALLGSTAHDLLQRLPCDVLLVRG